MAEAMTFFIFYQTARLNSTSGGDMLRMVGDPCPTSGGNMLRMVGDPFPSKGGDIFFENAR